MVRWIALLVLVVLLVLFWRASSGPSANSTPPSSVGSTAAAATTAADAVRAPLELSRTHDEPSSAMPRIDAVAMPQPTPASAVRRPAGPRGIVVDPNGSPVPRASIYGHSLRLDGEVASSARNISDDAGRFCLDTTHLGTWQLQAVAAPWAPSEIVETTTPSGEGGAEVRLVLRRGAHLIGHALDLDGKPDVNRAVRVLGPPLLRGQQHWDLLTDAEGRFDVAGLLAGRHSISREIGAGELEAVTDPARRARLLVQMNASQSVDVADGATVSVVLGAALARAVLVTGTVAHAERLGKKLVVRALPEESQASPSDTIVVERGRYELSLGASGAWRITLESSDGRLGTWRVTIPQHERFELDLTTGDASVTGRVVNHDRTPHADARVHAVQLDERGEASTRRGTRTAEDGSFRIEHLAAGPWNVGAVDPHLPQRGTATHAAQTLELGADEQHSGVELVFAPHATLRVELRGPHVPQRGLVYGWNLRDRERRVELRLRGPGPSYSIEGLEAGAWCFGAAHEALASPLAGPLEVVEGRLAEVTLTLAPAAFVVAELGRPDEELAQVVLVCDGNGVVVVFANRGSRSAVREFTRNERSALRLGPIPPGRYTLIGRTRERVLAEREFVAEASREAIVSLAADK